MKFFRVLVEIHRFWEESASGEDLVLGFMVATFMGVILAVLSVTPFTPVPLLSWILLASGFSLIFLVIIVVNYGGRGAGSILIPTFYVFFGANMMMLLEGRLLALITLAMFFVIFANEFSFFWKKDSELSTSNQASTTPTS